jgi:ribosome-binding factor A
MAASLRMLLRWMLAALAALPGAALTCTTSVGPAATTIVPPRAPFPLMMPPHAKGGGTRRSSRVGHVVQAELATIIRSGDVHGEQRIPNGLQQLISIVDVDMSPDLRNARVKISVIGDRKEKVSAVRWLRGNVRGLRHELAKRNRQMKRIPMLTFDHVDVGAATDMMFKLEALNNQDAAAARARGEGDVEEDGGIDFSASDEDAWLDEDDPSGDDAFGFDEEVEEEDVADVWDD